MTTQDSASRNSRPWLLAVQIVLALLALLCLSSAAYMKPIWTTEPRTQMMLALLAGVFVFLVLALKFGERRGRAATALQVLLVGSLAIAPFLASAHLFHQKFSRLAMIIGAVLALGLAWLIVAGRGRAVLRTALLALLAVVGIALQVDRAVGGRDRDLEPTKVVTHVSTARYPLKLTAFEGYIERPETQQGGLTLFRDGYLLTTGDGDLYFMKRSQDGQAISVDRWPIKVPINAAEFNAAAGNAVNLQWFRVADVLATEAADGFRLFVTHHFWKVDQKCWVYRVSSLAGRFADLGTSMDSLHWETLFEARPCIPLETALEPKKFDGLFSGGRMILLGNDELLVSVGNNGLEAPGYGLKMASSQDPDVSYGKTILIHLRDGSSEDFSIGHRNPQGLHRGPSGVIWSSEHGPQGGDELNRIVRGGNYGWPLATYGVQYGTHAWPLSGTPEQIAGMEEPFMSWYPSIGPSNLIEVTSPLFEYWRGDLLMASLRDNSLWRFRIRSDRMVLSEQIKLGERLRDILEGHRGEIVLWTDSNSLIFIEPDPDTMSGQSLYFACASCHVAPEGAQAVGPPLAGVLGRKVASVPGFDYSRSLRQLGGTWTRKRLDAFISNPNEFSPGTSMQFPGLQDPVSRANLVEYLASPGAELDVVPTVFEHK
jgi:aldose sugar dehydrogenase